MHQAACRARQCGLHTCAAEASRNYRDGHLVVKVRVNDSAKDKVGIGVDQVIDDGSGLVDLKKCEVGRPGDVPHHAGGLVDAALQQRRLGRLKRRLTDVDNEARRAAGCASAGVGGGRAAVESWPTPTPET
eukprot:363308-Chlamydomonas_euryale.AAC.9